MSRRCGSSKPTPTPLNGKATKPAKYVKTQMKGRPSLKKQEEIVNESHRHATRNGGGRQGRCMKKRKVNTKNEKNNNTEDVKNPLNPGHNSGNASCATNKWPDYPDQPKH